MPKFITLKQAIIRAKKIKPNWIAVNKDGHINAHIDKPKLGIVRGYWISNNRTIDMGFFRNPEDWESTLRKITYD